MAFGDGIERIPPREYPIANNVQVVSTGEAGVSILAGLPGSLRTRRSYEVSLIT